MYIIYVPYSKLSILKVHVLNKYHHQNSLVRSYLSRGLNTKKKYFDLLYTIELEQSGHLGLEPVITDLSELAIIILISNSPKMISHSLLAQYHYFSFFRPFGDIKLCETCIELEISLLSLPVLIFVFYLNWCSFFGIILSYLVNYPNALNFFRIHVEANIYYHSGIKFHWV